MKIGHGLVGAAAIAALLGAGGALAGSNTIGFEYDFEVDSSGGATDGEHKNNGYVLSYSHAFDNNVILGASGSISQNIIADTATQQVEGTVGYKAAVTKAFSITTSIGAGERFNDTTYDNFPYWVARASADLALSKALTWQLVFIRIRNAFDPDVAWNTPQIGTQASYKLNDSSTIYAKIYESFKNHKADVDGVGVGYRFMWK